MEPRARVRPFRRRGPLRTSNASTSETETINHPPKSETWQPAIVDVLKTKRLLHKASKDTLPLELINGIMDYAEYWPHVSASKAKPIVALGNSPHQDVLVIRTPPICALATAGCEDDSLGLPEPSLLHPARKVIFRIVSQDQGYSSESEETQGLYQASHTWFDSEIDKEFGPTSEDEPLSRIPWDLSSTRFLNAWPKHSHSQGNDERNRTVSSSIAETEAFPEQKREGSESTNDSPSTEHKPTNDEQSKQTNNPEHPEPPEVRLFSHKYLENHKYEVQYNVRAKKGPTEHTIVWRYTDNTPEDSPEADKLESIGRGRATGDGRFVRCLKLGDCVSLWAKARYLNWSNNVKTATVEVYFAI